jgi:sulfur carrier protein
MNVYINGKETKLEDGSTLEHLLETINIDKDKKGIAVAVNDTVKPRGAWPDTIIQPGDRVEIIRAVQGG